jgi:hypothetical protein
MPTDLQQAVEAAEIVEGLSDFGFTKDTIAKAINVSSRAMRDWRIAIIRPANYDRLQEFRDLVVLLTDSLTARGVVQWLQAKNRYLGGERPVDVMGNDQYERVLEAARAFVEGTYL